MTDTRTRPPPGRTGRSPPAAPRRRRPRRRRCRARPARACSAAPYFSSRTGPTIASWRSPSSARAVRPGPQQPVGVLVRPHRRDEQHERLGHAVGRDPGAGLVGVARLEQVVVDRLVDQLELAVVDLQVPLDLRPQALGVDDDGLGDRCRARVAQPAVGPGQRCDRLGRGERVHRLHVDDDRPRRVHRRRHQGVEDVDAAERQPHRASRGARTACAACAARSTTDR